MRFAHMADCHLGGWRDQRMRDLGMLAFKKAIDICVEERVDFALICGDLFNTAIPGIEIIKEAMTQLKRLKHASIPVYLIPGSHDFSPTGKTALDLLQEADLCVNVFKGQIVDGKIVLAYTQDRTGVKLTGILGKRGTLERVYYETLDRAALEAEPGEKIFLFHSPIEEYKEHALMEAQPLSFFPKGHRYYAGGHVHVVMHRDEPGLGTVAYPGPLFPNSFSELEELKGGGLFIVDIDQKVAVSRKDIILKNVKTITLDCKGKSASDASAALIEACAALECADAIVLIRLKGVLESGSMADMDLRAATDILTRAGAYFVMRNSSALESAQMSAVEVGSQGIEQIESDLIALHAPQIPLPGALKGNEQELLRVLLADLSSEKADGEPQAAFEERLVSEARSRLRLN